MFSGYRNADSLLSSLYIKESNANVLLQLKNNYIYRFFIFIFICSAMSHNNVIRMRKEGFMEHQKRWDGTSSAVIAKDLLPKTVKPNETGRHLTVTLLASDLYITCQITLWSAFYTQLPTFIMLAIIISALFIAAAMVMNGAAGSKYGAPFAMILRGSIYVRGALFLDLREGNRGNYVVRLAALRGSLAFLF